MNFQDLFKDKAKRSFIIIGLICGGLSYWFQPYNERTVFGVDIYLLMGVLAFVASLLAGLTLRGAWFQISLLICAAFVTSDMGRVFFDVTFIDKSHHNLWPFEILFALGVIVPSSFAGVFIAHLIHKVRR